MQIVRYYALLLMLALSISACSSASATLVPSDAPTRSPLPPGFSILPPFMPAFPCEVENVTASDEKLCRYERVQEMIISDVEPRILIQRDYHIGQGCWSGINVDTHELKVCDQRSSQSTILTSHLASPVLLSPDGRWFAFNTFEWDIQPEKGALPIIHVYRVHEDGTNMQQLDTQGLPPETVGAELVGWSPDSAWLQIRFWDGTENSGWHKYRLKADGSGLYERDNSLGTATSQPISYYMTEAQTPLRDCSERSCVIFSAASAGTSLPILARHDVGSDYWLEVEYDRQRLFVGPFIMVSMTYAFPDGAARSCPRTDCPVRFTIPVTDYILSLDVVVTNLVEYWTHSVYQGAEVYLGPWTPPPGNDVWLTTVIPASEAARAQGTYAPTLPSLLGASATATLAPTHTPANGSRQ